jgi:2-polyprenyl-3-methyl-5-hydroxy-6-metoxy-1,4-benzoquinol methylase
MRMELLKEFCDPDDGSPLEQANPGGELCNHAGRHLARFVHGVPSFVETDGYAANFGIQWRKFPRIQLDSYNGSTHSRDRLCGTAGWAGIPDLSGQRVLEVGCGAGRFTEILAQTAATVFSFDYTEAAFVNQLNNGNLENVAVFRADLYAIPLPRRTFDLVICLGVLQHTPDVEKAFRSIADMVAPGGMLVVDAYSRSWRQLLHWKYLLRPLTTRMAPQRLLGICQRAVPHLMPISHSLWRIARPLARLIPIMDQSGKHVSSDIRREWCILDTYDAFAAAYDQPQSRATVVRWFEHCGFGNIVVGDGTVVRGRGRKCESPSRDMPVHE